MSPVLRPCPHCGDGLPVYDREHDKPGDRREHLLCYSCGCHWIATGGRCPRCGEPTVTTDKRGTKPDRREEPPSREREAFRAQFADALSLEDDVSGRRIRHIMAIYDAVADRFRAAPQTEESEG